MAFELYGMLAGNVSTLTGENVKPAYGGEEEAFLRKVVTPIYNTIIEVIVVILFTCFCVMQFLSFLLMEKAKDYIYLCFS